MTVFFLRFDFSGVWNDNVSSMFNYTVSEYGKPFITWHSFTVGGYLWATIGVTFGLVICICLLGYAAGVFVRNGYGAFIVAALVAVVVKVVVIKPINFYDTLSSSIVSAFSIFSGFKYTLSAILQSLVSLDQRQGFFDRASS
ncbi:MAG: hypothetical protein JJE17_09415 [Peptostreptococcaceae bacterium]|nr:hypothetical protein [Peptostreptococcaceae bacterium]